jgi:hypothetical protein
MEAWEGDNAVTLGGWGATRHGEGSGGGGRWERRRSLEEEAGVAGTVGSGAGQERAKVGQHVGALREWATGARRRTVPRRERVREHATYEGRNKGNGSHDVRTTELSEGIRE